MEERSGLTGKLELGVLPAYTDSLCKDLELLLQLGSSSTALLSLASNLRDCAGRHREDSHRL